MQPRITQALGSSALVAVLAMGRCIARGGSSTSATSATAGAGDFGPRR